MGEDLHKDNLEDFFKDSFEEQSDSPSPDGWDIPSDQVWDKINTSINSDDSNNERLGFWRYLNRGLILVFLLIIGTGLISYFAYNQKDVTDYNAKPTEDRVLNNKHEENNTILSVQEQDNSKQQFSDLSTETQSDNKKTTLEKGNNHTELNNASPKINKVKHPNSNNPSLSNSKLPQTSDDKKDRTPPSLNEQNSSGNNNSKKIKELRTPNDSNTPEVTLPISSSKPKDIAILTENDSPNSSNVSSEDKGKGLTSSSDVHSMTSTSLNDIELLKPISIKQSIAKVHSASPDTMTLSQLPFFDLKQGQKNPPLEKAKGFYAGISLAPIYTSRKINIHGNPVIPRVLNQAEEGKLSFSTGLNFGYKISNNWSIESGFSYSKFVLQHNRRKQVRYTSIGEQEVTPGRFQGTYDFNFSTSSGDIDTDIALTREAGTAIPENDFINLMLTANQNIKYGSIPIIARYQFGKGKFQYGLKAGIVNRFVLDGTFQIENVSVLRSDISLVLTDRIYKPRPIKNIEKYHLDFLVGAGLSYKLNQHTWFYIEPTFTHGINSFPLFETPNFKTLLVTTSIDFGFNYLF